MTNMRDYKGIDVRLCRNGYISDDNFEDSSEKGEGKFLRLIETESSGSIFGIHVTVKSVTSFTSQALAFRVEIDGEITNFRSWKRSELEAQKDHGVVYVIEDKDMRSRQKASERSSLCLSHGSQVRVEVFPMHPQFNASGGPDLIPDKKDQKGLVVGQLITRGTPLGSGNHYVVNDEWKGANWVILGERMAEFTWNCKSRVELEQLLVLPRPIYSPFKLLPISRTFWPADLTTPITDRDLTTGMDLEAIESLVFEHLDRNKLSGRHIDEITELAQLFKKQDVSEFSLPEIKKFATLQLQKHIHEEIHTRSLWLQTYFQPKANGQVDATGAHEAATMEIDTLVDKDLEYYAEQHALIQIEWHIAGTRRLSGLCQEQTGFAPNIASRPDYYTVQLFAQKRVQEKAYFQAKILILRALAEVILAERTKAETGTGGAKGVDGKEY